MKTITVSARPGHYIYENIKRAVQTYDEVERMEIKRHGSEFILIICNKEYRGKESWGLFTTEINMNVVDKIEVY